MATVESARSSRTEAAKLSIVDCDVHNALPSRDAIKPYLPSRLHAMYDAHPSTSSHGHGVSVGSRWHHGIFRDDAFPPEGGAPGSSLPLMQEQLLDEFGIERAILSPLESLGWVQYGELGRALARGLNEAVRVDWLDRDSRLYAAITVPSEDAVGAAEEIRRVAALDGRFVQVLMLIASREPLGHPKYWPIYEAAVECGLPVAAHVGGPSGTLTPVGWVPYQVVQHSIWPTAYQAQVISLVSSGVFTHYPDLQIVLEEGGITWMPSLMWRLERMAPAFREQVPQLRGRPTDIIREHFYFTTQPIDEPDRPEYLTQVMEQIGMTDRIMFASDYPHWDFDSPTRTLQTEISADARRAIFAGNAERLYAFDR